MASDIVQRLRDRAKFNTAVFPYNLMLDAADELESAEKAEALMREHIAAQDRRIAELDKALKHAYAILLSEGYEEDSAALHPIRSALASYRKATDDLKEAEGVVR